MRGTERYRAFISYSHAADGQLAPALQRGLHRLAKPWYRSPPWQTFRDQTSLAVTPALWSSIEQALASSGFFILMASPRAAASPWVQREVSWWLAHRPPDRLLLALTDGSLHWDPEARDFDPATSDALPPNLLGVFEQEPLWVDLRWARSGQQASLRHPAFRNAVAELAAPLHGVEKERLVGEDMRQQRRFVRWRNSAIGALATVTVVAVGAAAIAVDQRDVARAERDTANSRRLASDALDAMEKDLDLGLLLAVESHRLTKTTQARDSLLRGMLTEPGLLRYLHGHTATVTSMAAAGDGTAVSVGVDGEVIVWDRNQGKVVRRFTLPTQGTAAAVSPDGGIVAFDRDGDVALREVASGRETILSNDGAGATDLAFAPDGRRLASVRSDGGIVIWNLRSRAPRQLGAGPNGTSTMAFDPTGRWLAAGGIDGEVELYDLHSGRRQSLPRLVGLAGSVAFSPDGKTLAASSGDIAIALWDVGSRRRHYLRSPDTSISEFSGLLSIVVPLAFAPDGLTLVSGQPDGSVTTWDLRRQSQLRTDRGHNRPVTSVALDPKGEALLTGTDSGVIAVRDPAGEDPLAPALRGPIRYLTAVAVSPDGRLVAAGGCDPAALEDRGDEGFYCSAGVVAIWDMSGPRGGTGAPRLLRGHADFVRAVVFSPDGATLVSGGGDGKVVEWNLGNGSRRLLGEHNHEVMTAAFTADGDSLAWATFYGEVVTLEIAAGKRSVVQPERRQPNSTMPIPATSVAYRHDGRLLFAGYDNGELYVWDLRNGQRRTLAATTEKLLSIATHPDDQTLASAAADGTIQRWDSTSGSRTDEPILDRGFRGSVAFSPDGTMLASSSQEGVILWDLDTGQPMGRPLPGGAAMDVVAFNALSDRPVLVSAGGDVAQRWEVDSDVWAARACARANRNLTRQEWNRFMGRETRYRTTC
jgi:WD40 repeat protein